MQKVSATNLLHAPCRTRHALLLTALTTGRAWWFFCFCHSYFANQFNKLLLPNEPLLHHSHFCPLVRASRGSLGSECCLVAVLLPRNGGPARWEQKRRSSPPPESWVSTLRACLSAAQQEESAHSRAVLRPRTPGAAELAQVANEVAAGGEPGSRAALVTCR